MNYFVNDGAKWWDIICFRICFGSRFWLCMRTFLKYPCYIFFDFSCMWGWLQNFWFIGQKGLWNKNNVCVVFMISDGCGFCDDLIKMFIVCSQLIVFAYDICLRRSILSEDLPIPCVDSERISGSCFAETRNDNIYIYYVCMTICILSFWIYYSKGVTRKDFDLSLWPIITCKRITKPFSMFIALWLVNFFIKREEIILIFAVILIGELKLIMRPMKQSL